MALQKIRKSFNTFKDKSWITWYYKINSISKIILTKLLKKVLLNKIYRKRKIDINIAINICIYFNYVINGSLNISHKKIVDLFFYTKIKVF